MKVSEEGQQRVLPHGETTGLEPSVEVAPAAQVFEQRATLEPVDRRRGQGVEELGVAEGAEKPRIVSKSAHECHPTGNLTVAQEGHLGPRRSSRRGGSP